MIRLGNLLCNQSDGLLIGLPVNLPNNQIGALVGSRLSSPNVVQRYSRMLGQQFNPTTHRPTNHLDALHDSHQVCQHNNHFADHLSSLQSSHIDTRLHNRVGNLANSPHLNLLCSLSWLLPDALLSNHLSNRLGNQAVIHQSFLQINHARCPRYSHLQRRQRRPL